MGFMLLTRMGLIKPMSTLDPQLRSRRTFVLVRQVLLILPLLVLAVTPSVAQAQDSQQLNTNRDRTSRITQRKPSAAFQGSSGWLSELNLSPNQTRRLQAISQQYQPQIDQRQQNLRQLRAELQDLLSSNASSSQIREKHRQVEALQQEVRQLNFESMLSMREVLTPEQRLQFEAHMRDRKPGFRGRYLNRN